MFSLKICKEFHILLGVIMFLHLPGMAQEQRTISKMSWRDEPIKIVKLKTKGKVRELDKRFAEEDDWLRGLTVTVKNVSNKLISRIELDLSFPRPEGSSETLPTYGLKLIYGLDPAEVSDREMQKHVQPGESVDLKLPEANLPLLSRDLESLGYTETITSARISVDSVTFSDGSMWAADEILYPRPENPKRKINPKFPPTREGTTIQPVGCKLSEPCFQNAAFTSVNARRMLRPHRLPLAKLSIVQASSEPCNTVWVTEQTHDCGNSGSGCTFKQNVFDDSIELLGLRNARKELSSVRCQRTDGTFVRIHS